MRLLPREAYPDALVRAGFGDTPLWAEGNLDLLKAPKVAVIGSRNASREGVRRTQRLARHLVAANACVVSGLAEGIDTAAHTETLERGGLTVAVLGTPLDKCFPTANKPLMARIAKDGLLLSQFAPGDRVGRGNFPARNRLMAALSNLSVVVEATAASGTRHQVAACVNFHKPVGFLASLVRRNYPWIGDALATGYGFVAEGPADVVEVLTEENFAMWLPLSCTECALGRLATGVTAVPSWIPCQLTDDGVYRAQCPEGHPIRAVLQNLQHEVLFESGAAALLLGFHREAVTSLYAALEHFVGFGTQVLLAVTGVPQTPQSVASPAAQPLSAFLPLYARVLNAEFPNVEDLSGLRNRVVHNGYRPTREETLAFGRRVFEFIAPTQRRLAHAHPDAFAAAARQPVFAGHRRLHEMGESPRKVGELWTNASTMLISMALSHNIAGETPHTFDVALKEVEQRLPWYGS